MVQHADIDHTGLTGVGESGTAAHIADAADAHDASAISVLDTAANFTGDNVESVLAELQDNIDGVGGVGGIVFKHAISTAAGADQTFTTSFANLFSTQLQTVIAASAGDVLEMVLVYTHNDTDGQSCMADFHIGATTNARIGDATVGSFIYFHPDANGTFYTHVAMGYRVVVANDISGGNVTVTPMIRSDVNGNPDVKYNAPPTSFVVKNLGAEA
jgi:hypothetical protein